MTPGEGMMTLRSRREIRLRILWVGALILLVGLSHWLTPVSHHGLHAVHVLLRKFFVLPIVLAAVWFELRGGILACLTVTAVYLPHILLQWAGNAGENINQAGELGSLWLVGLLAGVLVQREKTALREVARTHEGALLALVAALDAREHETEMHSQRVRAYALRIGREMGLSSDQLRLLAHAAILHDIGKIGVPDSILLKPGPLNEEEWDTMRRHPQIGRGILSVVPFLAKVAEIVHSHHEKFDGTGYPQGLGGQGIPLVARVYAVADVFDALTSDRPYRQKMSVEEARSLIRRQAGTHFDPQVAEAFLKVNSEEWVSLSQAVTKNSAET